MKTFKEYGGDTVDPHYHAYGGSLLGPSLGQYRPVADLNANRHNNSKKQLLGQSNLELVRKRSPSQT